MSHDLLTILYLTLNDFFFSKYEMNNSFSLSENFLESAGYISSIVLDVGTALSSTIAPVPSACSPLGLPALTPVPSTPSPWLFTSTTFAQIFLVGLTLPVPPPIPAAVNTVPA